ncbi:MAG: VWA domain-containing protein [Planctomycetaceae bacterium]|nr:VWA domain-containing protein [Planctomycetaceae bacterium]
MSTRRFLSSGLMTLFLLSGFLFANAAFGQGVLIWDGPVPLPRPHMPRPAEANYRITHIGVEGRIQDQIADIQISQTFHNCGSRVIEAQFVFPLPEGGAIDQLTLMVNGHELSGKLMNRDEARRRYEAIVRANRDPALLEWIGHGMFQTSVFPIPAGETRTVTLHYSQLLKRDHDLTEFVFPLSTAKYTAGPIDELSVNLAVSSSTALKNLYSPSHDIGIKRNGKKRANIILSQKHVVPTSDFRLYFDTKEGDVSADLLSFKDDSKEEGYFLLLASPEIKAAMDERVAKTVLFVVDKSGSMSGKKIEQARDALKFVLNNLRKDDLFNIVAYDSKVEEFRPELERYNDETREEALAYVDGLYAGGGTNIHEALSRGLSMLKDNERPTYVLFLTDGRPTNGITNETQIASAAKSANTCRARMMAFGVGHDVNSRLLDRLSRDGFGTSEYVTPDEDIEEHVAKIYNRISSPVLSHAKVAFDSGEGGKGPKVSRLYPDGEFDLFEGEQLVIVGRYKRAGDVTIKLTGKVGDRQETYTFDGELTDETNRQSRVFVAKLWATRRIGELIDELDLHGRNQELVDELIALSTKHGILTPYTSFLADETTVPSLAMDGAAFSNNSAVARDNLQALEAESGADAFAQRAIKQNLKQSNRGGGVGGYSGQLPAPALAGGRPAPGNAAQPVSGPVQVEEVIRNSGVQTLYKRGKLVVTPETAEVDVEKEKDQIQVVQRFSDDYFKLIAANTVSENNLLSQQGPEENLLVKLRGQVYLIE